MLTINELFLIIHISKKQDRRIGIPLYTKILIGLIIHRFSEKYLLQKIKLICDSI